MLWHCLLFCLTCNIYSIWCLVFDSVAAAICGAGVLMLMWCVGEINTCTASTVVISLLPRCPLHSSFPAPSDLTVKEMRDGARTRLDDVDAVESDFGPRRSKNELIGTWLIIIMRVVRLLASSLAQPHSPAERKGEEDKQKRFQVSGLEIQ